MKAANLHLCSPEMHDLLNVFQVRSIAIIGLVFVSLAFLNAAFLLPASAAVSSESAPCHQDRSTPIPLGHHNSNHDCCTVGHNRALPSASVDISTPLFVSVAGLIPYVVLIDSEQHRLSEFNDSGPPGSAPLRI